VRAARKRNGAGNGSRQHHQGQISNSTAHQQQPVFMPQHTTMPCYPQCLPYGLPQLVPHATHNHHVSLNSTALGNSQPFTVDEDGPLSNSVHSSPVYLDSGASSHQISPQVLLSSTGMRPTITQISPTHGIVSCGNGKSLPITSRGRWRNLSVQVVPGARHHLFSIGQYVKDTGQQILFDRTGAHVGKCDGKGTRIGKVNDNMYELDLTRTSALMSTTPTRTASHNPLYRLHVRLSHASPRYLASALLNRSLLVSPYHRMPMKTLKPLLAKWLKEFPVCPSCKVAKLTRHKVSRMLSSPPTAPMHTLHIDRCGPSTPSKEGNKHWLPVVDGHSGYIIPLFTEDASGSTLAREFSRIIGPVLLRLRKLGVYYITSIKSDNEKAIVAGEMKALCQSLGIMMYPTSSPYKSIQNGKAERAIRTITESSRVSMTHHGAPKNEWEHAVRHSCYHYNRLPKAHLGGNSPYSLFWGLPSPSLDYLKPFYCPVFVKSDKPMPKTQRFSPVGLLGNFIGYPPNSHLHRTYLVRLRNKSTPIVIRNAYFIEDLIEAKRISTLMQTNGRILAPGGVSVRDGSDDKVLYVETPSAPTEPREYKTLSIIPSLRQRSNEAKNSTTPTPNVRTLRANRGVPPIRMGVNVESNLALISQFRKGVSEGAVDYESVISMLSKSSAYIPKSYWDAMKCKQADVWLQASATEISKLEKLDTWDVVDRPPDERIMNLMFIYSVKSNESLMKMEK